MRKIYHISSNVKVLIFALMIVLVLAAGLISMSRGDDVFVGEGMVCFEKCADICSIRDSKMISFTATDEYCGCTCNDKYQEQWRIVK